jgi:two-component sensor histidine kinase
MLQNKSIKIHESYNDQKEMDNLIINEFSNKKNYNLLLAKYNNENNHIIINKNSFKNKANTIINKSNDKRYFTVNINNSTIFNNIIEKNTFLIDSTKLISELSFNNSTETIDRLLNFFQEKIIISPVCKNGQVTNILFFSSNEFCTDYIPFINNFSFYLSTTLSKPQNHKYKELEETLKKRELLIQEIHHRVKNNLQIIVSLIDLQADAIKKNPEYLDDIKSRIQLMAILHDKIYHTSNFNEIYLKEYVESIAENIFKTYNIYNNNIKINIESDNIILSFQKAISCGLILNELLQNSLKHAFPNKMKGNIKIIIKSIKNKIQIIISDDGIGFPKNIEFKNTQTLGLQLIYMLICQLKGEIILSEGKGTTFKISFEK